MSAVDQMSLVLRKKKQDEIEETHSLAVGSRENFLAVIERTFTDENVFSSYTG